MGEVVYLSQDITTVTRGVIAHGCNCQGKMGAGAAKDIAAKWPIVFRRYGEYIQYNRTATALLGSVCVVSIAPDLLVANCFTQQYYGRQPVQYCDLEAINSCLRQCIQLSREHNLPLYTTRIGGGLGGADWDSTILPMYQALCQEFDVDIFVCSTEVK